ncbi:hypothetical protein DYB32_003603 [Aphanomyces invadans]|uniref:BTB domain-containing protein n=1 Tax=Aphanomyces invadans TaxID=157072 RepID=A0A3R6VCZ0_9STRA|nr:hypothetical protein DYB32_003603 [Aphanomyces invadans]
MQCTVGDEVKTDSSDWETRVTSIVLWLSRHFENASLSRLHNKQIKQVTCGSYHTAAVTVSGELYTWGGGMYGKLGHGNEIGHSVPYLVETLSNLKVDQVACGSRHTVVLLKNSDVYTWGDKENGVSGQGDTDGHQYLPSAVEELKNKGIKQIAAYTGDVFTWGNGDHGKLGHNDQAMFSSGMRESREMEVPVPLIRVPVFLALLEYIYNDTVSPDMKAEMAIELYACADMYGLDRLKGLCEAMVQKGLVVDNASVLLQAADELQASRLREICMHFIVRHFDYVTKTEGFHMLSRDLILETLQNR